MGTGYSLAANGSSSVPPDEIGMATHLYTALQVGTCVYLGCVGGGGGL